MFLKGLPLNATLHLLPKQIFDHSHYGQEGLFVDEIDPRQIDWPSDAARSTLQKVGFFAQINLVLKLNGNPSAIIVTVNNRAQSMHVPPRLKGCAFQECGCIRERVKSLNNKDFLFILSYLF
uniref:Uncharacterized protein n=1 Tax=Echinococcus canadensis TaxID=519352 RepID=A0A915EXI9_9CEST